MLFEKDHRQDPDNCRRYAIYEIAYTLIDFTAALLFVVGSVMFFYESWQTTGTWLFLIGSLCFAAKPTIRLVRDIHLAAMGDTEDLAKKVQDEG